MREHGIRCTLEMISNGGFKQGHLKHCSSTIENISITVIFIATKLNRTVTCYEGLRTISMILLSRVLAKSRDKLKVLYLPYQNGYDHKAIRDGNLPWWGASHNVTCLFDLVVLWDQVTHQKYYISTTTVPMEIEIKRMVAYLEGFLKVSHHPLNLATILI